jgi:hypothetical protein
MFSGGGGGIRTHEAISDLLVFKTSAFNQALPPLLRQGIIHIFNLLK